jgi:hypothetical protein
MTHEPGRPAGSAEDAGDDQPDPEASSDGDRSWTEDPVTADPTEDRSVDAVIERTSGVDGDESAGV